MASDPAALNLDGLRTSAAAELLGKTPAAAKSWLNHNGYRIADGKVRRVRPAGEVQDAIAARIAACPPSVPCWRCGARAGCQHRLGSAAVAS